MGFFNWVMHGLGFEDTEKAGKTKVVTQTEDKYAALEVNSEQSVSQPVATQQQNVLGNFGFQSGSNTVICEPKTQADIRKVIDYLKQGQCVNVDLQAIADEDRDKILNFLSGAIYGLNGSIHRLQGDLFLLAPEGHKILKPNGENKG